DLPVVLDAVCGDVMQERRAVLAGGTCVHETRMFAQQAREGRDVAADDGVRRLFERRDRRRRTEGPELERGPRQALEAVRTRDDELRLGERTVALLQTCSGELRNLPDQAVDLTGRHARAIVTQRVEVADPARRPLADGALVGTPARAHELLGA